MCVFIHYQYRLTKSPLDGTFNVVLRKDKMINFKSDFYPDLGSNS